MALPSLQLIAEKYAEHDLVSLTTSDEFRREVLGTGENESNFLTRRWSFMRPKIVVSNSTPECVKIQLSHGINKLKTLYVIDREVITNPKGKEYLESITVPSFEKKLSTIESKIAEVCGVKSFRFPDDIRDKDMVEFVSVTDEYTFNIRINVSTLSVYADVVINVVLDHMNFKDAVNKLLDVGGGLNKPCTLTDVFYMQFTNPTDSLAARYRQHMRSFPSTLGGQSCPARFQEDKK